MLFIVLSVVNYFKFTQKIFPFNNYLHTGLKILTRSFGKK